MRVLHEACARFCAGVLKNIIKINRLEVLKVEFLCKVVSAFPHARFAAEGVYASHEIFF